MAFAAFASWKLIRIYSSLSLVPKCAGITEDLANVYYFHECIQKKLRLMVITNT